jgi:ferredoxin--NADP+ reductase
MSIEELKKKKIIFIAGGVGTAPVYPQVKWLHEHGITADAIIGAKNKDLVILEKEFREVCNLFITTDDGSYGRVRNGHEMSGGSDRKRGT